MADELLGFDSFAQFNRAERVDRGGVGALVGWLRGGGLLYTGNRSDSQHGESG
jgi:hypothetical protein